MHNEMQKVLNIACSSLPPPTIPPQATSLGVDDGNNNQLSLEKFIYKKQQQQKNRILPPNE
jgi:hypothetical protein